MTDSEFAALARELRKTTEAIARDQAVDIIRKQDVAVADQLRAVAEQAAREERAKWQPKADSVRVYWMSDNHTFTRLEAATVDGLIAEAEALRNEGDTYGMLCPVVVMSGDKEIRRVAPGAHCNGLEDESFWRAEVERWRNAVEADADAPVLIRARKGKGESK